jgi:tRNA U34 5-methylaminomethyl-2-thiouridine-forming methyltransferase MnmC
MQRKITEIRRVMPTVVVDDFIELSPMSAQKLPGSHVTTLPGYEPKSDPQVKAFFDDLRQNALEDD